MKFQKILDRYDEFYSLDMFGESTEGHKRMPPYVPFAKRKVIVNMKYFDVQDEYPLSSHRRYNKQKVRSRVQAPPTLVRLLTGLFLCCFEIIKRNKGEFYCHENNVKVKVAMKFIDNQTKTT